MAHGDASAGFDHTQYEAEVVQRWGRAAYDGAAATWTSLGSQERERHLGEHEAIVAGLADARTRGAGADDAGVQDLVRRHHAWVSVFWTPGRDAYQGLGQMYVDDPRFARTYDQRIDGTAELLRDAIAVYAERNLA